MRWDEPDETFTVTIALVGGSELPDGFALRDATTTVTITDDDASPVLDGMDPVAIQLGQTVDITASATDADTDDTVTYQWTRKVGGDHAGAAGHGRGAESGAAELHATGGWYLHDDRDGE